MSVTDRSNLFDDWANSYDSSLSAPTGFPFDGYGRVLDEVVRLADVRPQSRILDLGIGTGNLAARFVRESCLVWGIDFSAEMLDRARAKLPQVHLVQADLLGEWPAELAQPFDHVVSAYVLHEFDLATRLELLRRIAAHHLSPAGCILVADIAFPSVSARADAFRLWADRWDEDEHYWAADETAAACEQAGLRVGYQQVSSCGGIFTFAHQS